MSVRRANSLPRSRAVSTICPAYSPAVAAVSRARSSSSCIRSSIYPSPCLFPFRPFYAPAAEGVQKGGALPRRGRAPHLNARLFQALRIGWVPAGGLLQPLRNHLGHLHPRRARLGPRRRKIRLTPVPPDGKTCVRSLAPPAPTGTRLRWVAGGQAACGGRSLEMSNLLRALRIGWVPAGLTSAAPKSLGRPSRPTRPPGAASSQIRLTPVPPDGKTCVRSLAPPAPTGTRLRWAAGGQAACGGRSLEMSNLLRALRIGWVPAGLTSAAPKSLGRPSRPTRPPGLGRGSRPRRRPRRRSRAGRSPARWTGPAGRSRT